MEMERRAAGVVFALNREVEGQNRVFEDEESLVGISKMRFVRPETGREEGC